MIEEARAAYQDAISKDPELVQELCDKIEIECASAARRGREKVLWLVGREKSRLRVASRIIDRLRQLGYAAKEGCSSAGPFLEVSGWAEESAKGESEPSKGPNRIRAWCDDLEMNIGYHRHRGFIETIWTPRAAYGKGTRAWADSCQAVALEMQRRGYVASVCDWVEMEGECVEISWNKEDP